MQSTWPVLQKPPVILAIFQLKFNLAEGIGLNKLIENDKSIRIHFPKRKDNYHSNIGFPGTPAPGVTIINAKADTKIKSYLYSTNDQKESLIIEQDSIAIVCEGIYKGWEGFKRKVLDCLNLFTPQLHDCTVVRTSIRFVNKFSFTAFSDPLDYFSTTISTDSELSFPLTKYSFKINGRVPNTDILTIINHALEPNGVESADYFFDIDVLDYRQIKFDLALTDEQMEQIRTVKNTIFFDTVKQKTLDLCN